MYLESATESLRHLADEINTAMHQQQQFGSRELSVLLERAVGIHRGLFGTWQLMAADYDYYVAAAQEDPRAAMYSSLTAVRQPGGSVVQDIVNYSFTTETVKATAKQAGTAQAKNLSNRRNRSSSSSGNARRRRGGAGGGRSSSSGTSNKNDGNKSANSPSRKSGQGNRATESGGKA